MTLSLPVDVLEAVDKLVIDLVVATFDVPRRDLGATHHQQTDVAKQADVDNVCFVRVVRVARDLPSITAHVDNSIVRRLRRVAQVNRLRHHGRRVQGVRHPLPRRGGFGGLALIEP